MIISKSKPSSATLNILSEYVGYYNWAEFCKKQESPNGNVKEKVVPDEMAITLLGICLKNHDFKTALEYLDIVQPLIEGERVYGIAPVFEKVLRKDRIARKVLIPELAKTQNRRRLTFEQTIDLEYLNAYYFDAIVESKKNIDYKNTKMANNDQVFYNSIMFLHFINRNNKKKSVKLAYNLFNKIRPEDADIDHIANWFPIIRYHATYLMYLYLTKQLNDKRISNVVEKIEEKILCTDFDDLISFAISEIFRALVFCKRYNDVLFLYKKYIKIGLKIDSADNYYKLSMEMVARSKMEVLS